MKASARESHGVLLLVLLVLVMGCSTKASVKTSRDQAADFSRYRSWSWLRVAREDASPRSDVERELSARVQRRVIRDLSERGLKYRAEDADLAVDARLAVTRERHIVHRNTAVQSLMSLHDSPSYEIQGTQRELVNYERGRLTIRVIDLRRNREVWRGSYQGLFRDAFAPHTEAAVASTLERFPAVPRDAAPFDPATIAMDP